MKIKNNINPIIKSTEFGLAKLIVKPIEGFLFGGNKRLSSLLK